MAVSTKARLRIVTMALGGMIVLAVALALGFELRRWRTGTGWSGGVARSEGGASVGGDASRTRPQAALREGRLDEAFAWYVGHADSGPGAEDLYVLGSALLAQHRVVLGWAAMEAARRIDRDHAATNRALDELDRRLNLAAGPDQASWHMAADEVEYLRSVRSGPAQGLFVLGLARYAESPGREREFLDRLLIRDRSVLRSVENPMAAARLVARLLMETGRAAEASDLLWPLVDGPGVDREAAWLLSRAALQLGQVETADAMLGRAGGFGRDGTSPESAPFVGSRKCAECHPSAYRAAQKASPHARTIHLGAGLKDVPLPDRPVSDPSDPRLSHRFTRRAADRIELEARYDDGRVARAVVAYALGSGEHGITMVTRDEPTGYPRQLRISYYAPDRSWRGTKGIDAVPHDPSSFIGLGLSERAMRQCLHCHTTWFRAALPIPTTTAGPEAADRGIGCERCHGPGLNHIKAVETGYAEAAIGAARDAPPRRLLQSCDECHASTGSVEPGDPEFTRVQGTTLKFSRCFTGSRGAIHCATCHDPHRGLDTTASHYETKCLDCHAAGAGTTAPPATRACPVNPASGCIDCHMPKVQDTNFQTRFTDHHIRVHPSGAG
jgi:hypothetical protein